MSVKIAINQGAVNSQLGNGARLSIEIGGQQVDGSITLSDAQFGNLSAEDLAEVESLKNKGLVVVTSDGVVVTDLSALGEAEGLAGVSEEVTSKLVDGETVSADILEVVNGLNKFTIKTYTEDITVAVGQGQVGSGGAVDGSSNLVKDNCFLLCAIAKVITAPGGGATTVDVGRKNTAADELVDGMSSAADTVSNSWDHATPVGIVHNNAADVISVSTDADVTGSDMVVRVTTFLAEMTNP